MSSKRKLEPTGLTPIEQRLRIIEEEDKTKKPKITKPQRSKLFSEIQSLLPKLEDADKQLQEKLKSGKGSELDLEVIPETESDCIEMVLDCGLFDSLNPDVNLEDVVVKQVLDEQLDKLTEEQLFQLMEFCSETHNEGEASGSGN